MIFVPPWSDFSFINVICKWFLCLLDQEYISSLQIICCELLKCKARTLPVTFKVSDSLKVFYTYLLFAIFFSFFKELSSCFFFFLRTSISDGSLQFVHWSSCTLKTVNCYSANCYLCQNLLVADSLSANH